MGSGFSPSSGGSSLQNVRGRNGGSSLQNVRCRNGGSSLQNVRGRNTSGVISVLTQRADCSAVGRVGQLLGLLVARNAGVEFSLDVVLV